MTDEAKVPDMKSSERSSEAAKPELSVVVPVRNEAGNIAPLIGEIEAALSPGPDFETIYIDDGSTDATAAELDDAKARYPRLRVLRHRSSAGQSAAIATGVAAARAEWVVTMDGDRQNVPADIEKLLAVRDDGMTPDLRMVAGYRRERHDSTIRRLSSTIANAVRRGLLRDGAIDTGCSLKLFRRDAFLALPQFDHMHRFLAALIQRDGGIVLQVPVDHRPRTAGITNYGISNRLWAGIVDLLGVMWLQRRRLPPTLERKEDE